MDLDRLLAQGRGAGALLARALAAVVERAREGESIELIHGDEAFQRRVFGLAGRSLRPTTPSQRALGPTLHPEAPLTELIAIAIDDGANDQRSVDAARRLGALGRADWLADAESFLRSESASASDLRPTPASQHRRRRAWLAYLDALPAAATLERARRWFHEPWPLSLAGERILIRHAEPADRSVLERAGADALTGRRYYRLCSVIDALARLVAPESIPLLLQVHDTVEYSYARWRACVAMARHADRPDVQATLTEALWDCEWTTRALACDGVDPRVAEGRLRALASDRCGPPSVREAASEALHRGTRRPTGDPWATDGVLPLILSVDRIRAFWESGQCRRARIAD